MSATNVSVRSAAPAAISGAYSESTTSPGDLVRAAAGSDAGAWRVIVDRYANMVERIARAHRLNDADAADVAQTVWLRLLQHIDGIRDPDRVAGWLATTARNECLRLCRQRGRVAPIGDAEILEAMREEPEVATPVESEDRDAALRTALDCLPPRQRAILDLLMVDPPVSYGDISTMLNIPIGSIGPTRRRSLQSLRLTCLAADLLPA